MIGIYALWWELPELVYIGQTTKSGRYQEHLGAMKSLRHYNNGVQECYNKYGNPSFHILEECSSDTLDPKEVQWIAEFDSTILGLNRTHGGGGTGSGVTAAGSKYSKYKILQAFSLLYKGTDTLKYISNKLNIGIGMLTHISVGTCHTWLQEEYPEKYTVMQANSVLRQKLNKGKIDLRARSYPEIIGPDGTLYNISNVTDFCKNNPLLGLPGLSNMHSVLRGDRLQHKGFRLADPKNGFTSINTQKIGLVSPEGLEFPPLTNLTEFCRSNPLLCHSPRNSSKGLSSLFRGERSSYLGFTIKQPNH